MSNDYGYGQPLRPFWNAVAWACVVALIFAPSAVMWWLVR